MRLTNALFDDSIPTSDTVRVFVGKQSREFTFSRRVLSSVAPYFVERLDASGLNFLQRNAQLNTLWLEELCPDMFELFAYYIENYYHQHSNAGTMIFQPFIQEAQDQDCCEELHWDLIHLHLFAARLGIDALQDAAMDAVQDMYLRCDWDITPLFVSQVYTECDPADSYRLRKWIVAMTAWSLGGSLDGMLDSPAEKMEALFQIVPDFWDDYVAHLDKSSKSRVKLQFKNPQLRLESNNLRNDERQFGYRQCSFHTHRSSVGQGKCLHTLVQVSPVPDLSFLDSDDEEHDQYDAEALGGITGEEMVSSPRTAIFELYLDTD